MKRNAWGPATPSPSRAVVNRAPTVGPWNLTTLEDTRLVLPAPGLLAAAADADADPLSVVSFTQPAHGTVTVAANGSAVYMPAQDFNGEDSFTVSMRDGAAPAVVGTVRTAVGERVAHASRVWAGGRIEAGARCSMMGLNSLPVLAGTCALPTCNGLDHPSLFAAPVNDPPFVVPNGITDFMIGKGAVLTVPVLGRLPAAYRTYSPAPALITDPEGDTLMVDVVVPAPEARRSTPLERRSRTRVYMRMRAAPSEAFHAACAPALIRPQKSRCARVKKKGRGGARVNANHVRCTGPRTAATAPARPAKAGGGVDASPLSAAGWRSLWLPPG